MISYATTDEQARPPASIIRQATQAPRPNPTPLPTRPTLPVWSSPTPGPRPPSPVAPGGPVNPYGGGQTGGPFIPQGGAGGGTGGPNMQPGQSFGPGNSLIGQQFTPQASQRLAGAQGMSTQAAQQLANLPGMQYRAVGPANTGQSQGVYDQLLKMAQQGGGGGGGSPFDGAIGGLNTQVKSALDAVMAGPDRGKLAGDAYDLLLERSRPGFEKEMRDVGSRAAALGRIGAGMTTSELGDVQLQRERELDLARRQLATESAGQTLDDRLAQLGAARDVMGTVGSIGAGYAGNAARANQEQFGNLLTLGRDLYGRERDSYGDTVGERNYADDLGDRGFAREQSRLGSLFGYEQGVSGSERTDRDELRGERAYQYGLDQDAINNRVRERAMGEDLLDRAYGRQRDQMNDAFRIGSAYDPTSTLAQSGREYSAQGEAAMQGVGDLLAQFLMQRSANGGGGTAVPYVAPPSVRDLLPTR